MIVFVVTKVKAAAAGFRAAVRHGKPDGGDALREKFMPRGFHFAHRANKMLTSSRRDRVQRTADKQTSKSR
jgi:hypothetical protein